ncbi:MAG TPA: alpha/beta hydrolase [Candidatus Dormibacteraeota bacterium]|nr:alpha/beta hydrolase [Candidatus Dormibacteraeota bacterium]
MLRPEDDPVELAVRDHPGGEPALLALHGLASNARWWDLVAARLPYRVVAPDLRGHGLSPKPDTGYGFDPVRADVVALLDRLGLDRVAVAGHSWGATVALELASAHPERVSVCVCVDGGVESLRAHFPTWERAEAALRPPNLVGVAESALAGWASGPLAEGSDAATALGLVLGSFEPLDASESAGPARRVRPRLRLDRHMAILRALYDADPLALLRTMTVPVVAVLAEGAPSAAMDANRASAATAARTAGGPWRAVWVQGGHDLPVQRPDAVAAAIGEAIAAAAAGPV